MSLSHEQLVNNETIEQLIKDTSVEILPLLIDSYQEEANERIAKMMASLKAKDFQTLEFESHTLAGTSLAIGASALGDLAKKTEQLCLAKQYDEAVQMCATLQDLMFETTQALQSVKQGL